MNTPLQIAEADPTTLPVGSQPVQVCPRLGTGTTVLIYNNDITNVAYVGYRTAGLSISNSIPVQPLASVTVSAARVLYGFCPTATVQLTVIPSGTAISPSPAQIQQQINTLGLATAAGQATQAANQQVQINQQQLAQINASLYSQLANPFMSDTNGNADHTGWASFTGGQPIVTAGVNGTVALPGGSGFPNGVQIVPTGGFTQEGINSIVGFPCNPGDIPVAHGMIYCANVAPNVTGFAEYAFLNAAGGLISFTSTVLPVISSNAWTKISLPALPGNKAPAGTATAQLIIGVAVPAGNVPATAVLYCAGIFGYNSSSAGVVPGDTALSQKFLSGALSGALIANTGLTVAQEVAALIASGSSLGTPGGTPLLHGFDQVWSYNTGLAAGASVTLSLKTMTKNGYVLNFRPTYSGASGTHPFARLSLSWQVGGGNDIGLRPAFIVPIQQNGIYCPVLATGPVRGPNLQVMIENFDNGVNGAITPTLDLWECTHHIARDDVRGDDIFGYAAPPGFTAPPASAPSSGILGASPAATTIPPSTTVSYLLPVYAGQIYIIYEIAGTGGPVTVFIQEMMPGTAGVFVDIWRESISAGNTAAHTFVFPRSPVLLNFVNQSAVNNVTVSWLANLLEFAS